MRVLGGGIALALFGLATRRPLKPEQPLRFYATVGFFQSAGFLGLATWAAVTAGAGKVAILVYTMPLWVALLAWPYLGERLSPRAILAVAMAFIGIALMVGRIEGSTWFADLLAIAGGLSWAIGIVYAKKQTSSRKIDLYRMTTWQALFAGVMLAVVALAVHERSIVWSPALIIALAYSVLIGNALGYVLWFYISGILSAGEASMGSLIAPVVGVVASWLQLGERPPLLEGVGMILVLGGVVTLSYVRWRETTVVLTKKAEASTP
jgi:drug/metabolite transporter (DMT)-like permease